MRQTTLNECRPSYPENHSIKIDLLTIPHKGKTLTTACFGPKNFIDNIEDIAKEYSCSQTAEKITFKPATTSESISTAAYGFDNRRDGGYDAKRDIFDQSFLQVGRIVKTEDGIFTNIDEINEKKLKQLLNGVIKVNGIYLLNDKIAFAPYESFETGNIEEGKFVEGGLARALEHSEDKVATILKDNIMQKWTYPQGVTIGGFNDVQEPVQEFVLMHTGGFIQGGHLVVGSWRIGDMKGYNRGYSFGVLEE